MESQFTFAKYEVVCRTENCANSNIALIVDALQDNPFVICGVCSIQITDISLNTKDGDS
jgi:hypothetical protein